MGIIDFQSPKAVECEKKASEAKDVDAKRLLIEAAREWHSMAARAERHGW